MQWLDKKATNTLVNLNGIMEIIVNLRAISIILSHWACTKTNKPINKMSKKWDIISKYINGKTRCLF
mgnify:CR=1 FL=1